MNEEIQLPITTDAVTEQDEGRCAPAPGSAQWSVELHADCPQCKAYINLLDAPDFWDGRTLDIPEHGTPNSDNLDVQCPECGHDFKVCCKW